MGTSLHFDAIRRLVPDRDDLKALLDAVLVASRPDSEEAWSGSGELGTVGARRVDADALSGVARQAAAGEARRMEQVYAAVAASLEATIRGDDGAASRAMLEAAAVEESAGRASAAAALAGAAVRLATRHGKPETVSLALRRQARAERALGELAASLEHYVAARSASEAAGDPPGQAEAAIGAGNVLEQQGRWTEAEGWYRSALEALEAVRPPTPAHWHARLNMHIVLRSRGEVASSASWLEDAEAVARALDDPARHAFLANARGQLAMAQEDPDLAERSFLEGLQAAGTPRASATIRLNLAECHLSRGRTLDAAEQARAAERDAIVGNAWDKLPEVYRMLGRAAAASDNPDAFVFFERSLELTGEATSLLLERAQTLQAYGEAERALDQARTAAQLWTAARDAYARLEVAGFRRPWADCFDAPFPSLDTKDSTS